MLGSDQCCLVLEVQRAAVLDQISGPGTSTTWGLESKSASVSPSVTSDSLRPHGLYIGSSVRGILHARLLEWVAIPFVSRSSRPRD